MGSSGPFFILKNMTEKYNKKIGDWGEDIAVDFLKKEGYKILNRNLRIGHKEIDIIASKRSALVFVEVKTRTSDSFGDGTEAMHYYKNSYLSRAAELFLLNNKWQGDVRFDLILVKINKIEKRAKIKHFKNIT